MSLFLSVLPTPHKTSTGLSFKKLFASNLLIIEKPLGLSISEHIFAKNLLYERPIETEIPTFFEFFLIIRLIILQEFFYEVWMFQINLKMLHLEIMALLMELFPS